MEMASSVHPVRRLLTQVFRMAARTYFRSIEVVGDVPVANVGSRLFASNHVNALVDPILVVTTAACPISPVAKSTLWNIPGLAPLLDIADAVPIVRRRDAPNKSATDNDEVFERIAGHLHGGGNILIFPEGTSHNEPHLVALRSGAGRMLARAKADGARDLEVQAVGLEFDERNVFRSRVLVVYGPVVRVADLGDLEGDALAERITELLDAGLRGLVVEGQTWEARVLVTRVAELLGAELEDTSLEAWNAIGRRVKAARALLRDDDALVTEASDAVTEYYAALGEARTSDLAVRDGGTGYRPARLPSLLFLLAVLPLALFGAVVYTLPYQVPRLVVRATKEESSDLTSTYKLGAGLVLFPLWALVGCVIAALTLPPGAAVACIAALLTSPFAALAWQDRLPRLADTFWLLLGRGTRLAHLRGLRARALDAIAKARARAEALEGA